MASVHIPGPLLSERTTLGLGGRAAAELRVGSAAGAEALPRELDKLGLRPFFLGRGSNVLAEDGEVPAAIVSLERIGPEGKQPEVASEGDRARVRVWGGAGLPWLLGWFEGCGLAGLETLVGVPGSLGGAVAMNAGSHGVEIGQRLARVRVFSPELGDRWLDPGEWTLGYRTFQVTGAGEWLLVLEADLLLDWSERAAVRAAARKWYQRKRAVQPVTARSAGCVFKNPSSGESAGRLMDAAGLKGLRCGGMAFSGMHANFLVNQGGGRSAEAFELIGLARERVLERFGVELEMEVRVCPWR